MDRRLLKEIVLANQLIDEERWGELEALSVGARESLLDTVLAGGYIRESVLLPLIGAHFGVEWVDLDAIDEIDQSFARELPDGTGSTHILPLYRDNGHVVVATSDIAAVEAVDQLREQTGWNVRLVYSSQEKIERLRARIGEDVDAEPVAAAQMAERSLEELANEAPIIKRVNLLIMQAISEGASDIHVEPGAAEAVVRYRVDGVLQHKSSYPLAQSPAIVSRIKIMADLNIAERRIPQDGRISIRVGAHEYDLRVATIPVLEGEGVVMRILDKGRMLYDLPSLGLSEQNLERFHRQVAKPQGMVLLTGPTGSGKTTTLYAAIAAIRDVEHKIITIEDPVEYHLDGITQINVNPRVGLTFASGLRSILRLDPDIIMVGEIRDTETAEIAVRASLTGHTVFATLHTNDAPSAVTRLLDMGLPPYLISSTVNAVLAQRLVRCVCPRCAEDAPATAAATSLLAEAGSDGRSTLRHGKGCEHCANTGLRGRTGIHELLEIGDETRRLINRQAPADEIRHAMRAAGVRSMRDDGIEKMLAGTTTAEEILRVTQVD